MAATSTAVEKKSSKKIPQKTILRDDLKNFISIDVTKLEKAAWNYKKDDEFMLGQLVGNLKANGQMENIIVRELSAGTYEVVNGNHRYDAVKLLGWKKIVAFNLGKVGQAHAEKIAIVTNETRFQTDQVKLAELMTKLQGEFKLEDLAKEMPWTEEQIENFAKLTEFNWDEPTPSGGGQGEGEVEADGFITVKLRLPESIATQLNDQIDRIKKLLHPEQADLKLISPVQSIEVMLQHVAQTPDGQLL